MYKWTFNNHVSLAIPNTKNSHYRKLGEWTYGVINAHSIAKNVNWWCDDEYVPSGHLITVCLLFWLLPIQRFYIRGWKFLAKWLHEVHISRVNLIMGVGSSKPPLDEWLAETISQQFSCASQALDSDDAWYLAARGGDPFGLLWQVRQFSIASW